MLWNLDVLSLRVCVWDNWHLDFYFFLTFGKSITEKGPSQMKFEGLLLLVLWVGHVTHTQSHTICTRRRRGDWLWTIACCNLSHTVLLTLRDLIASSISFPTINMNYPTFVYSLPLLSSFDESSATTIGCWFTVVRTKHMVINELVSSNGSVQDVIALILVTVPSNHSKCTHQHSLRRMCLCRESSNAHPWALLKICVSGISRNSLFHHTSNEREQSTAVRGRGLEQAQMVNKSICSLRLRE